VRCGGRIPLTEEKRDEAEPVHRPLQQPAATDHRPGSRDARLEFAIVGGDVTGADLYGNVKPGATLQYHVDLALASCTSPIPA
jgi:hypothetical protein